MFFEATLLFIFKQRTELHSAEKTEQLRKNLEINHVDQQLATKTESSTRKKDLPLFNVHGYVPAKTEKTID